MNDDNPLSLDATGDFELDNYDIDPADMELAMQLANFDPLDTPSRANATGTFHVPEGGVRASALPPRFRDPIVAAMKADPANAEAIERRMVGEAARQYRLDYRVKAGLGEGATAIQREVFQIEKDARKLEAEFLDIATQLAAVDHWRPEFDAAGQPVIDRATGQQTVRAYEKVQGEARRQMEGRQRQLELQMQALEKVEGPRRRAKALKQSVEDHKRLSDQIEDHAASEKMADDMVREERVKRMAEAKARMRRSVL
jgi:hypothetical protein